MLKITARPTVPMRVAVTVRRHGPRVTTNVCMTTLSSTLYTMATQGHLPNDVSRQVLDSTCVEAITFVIKGVVQHHI